MMWTVLVLLIGIAVSRSQYYGTYYCRPGRDVAVHLFEWKWTDVEKECSWLAQHGFCAVQVSESNAYKYAYVYG